HFWGSKRKIFSALGAVNPYSINYLYLPRTRADSIRMCDGLVAKNSIRRKAKKKCRRSKSVDDQKSVDDVNAQYFHCVKI
uniref:Uncharacterized protein n=1 Tax=Romanomermis culicivorax TaxID=13658 RepID=A0A915IZN0_ROMCU